MLRSLRGKSAAGANHRRKSNLAEPIIAETFNITLKAISSFVPATLLKELLLTDGAPMRPHSSMMHGVCMIADISGFTRLSGAFCARGKEGLDGLQSATSGYMGALVNTVYAFGGDVIKFAGDALIVVFETLDLSPEAFQRSCALAVQCAWVLKDISTAELTLHVGISCGEICFGQLGGFENKWECLISGNCIGELSQCLDDAPSKHVAITAQCFECLTDRPRSPLVEIEALQQESGCFLISNVNILSSCSKSLTEMTQAADDTIFLSQTACFVPRPVTQSLMSGSFDFLAELREVTTVFIKWDGYDSYIHRDLLSLQKFFYACQEILSDSGGFLRQFLVDDKGCVLIALWGVPTATFHDDCRRALAASVGIRSKLLDMKMCCSTGITTGVVYCGNVGNEHRREYAAVGDVVNLAARLMSKAAGEILLDENTYCRLPEDVHRKLKKQPLMAVKGKDKPITSYQFDATRTVQEDGRLGASLVNSTLIQELPIRQQCKDAFMGPLNNLLGDSPTKDLQFIVLEGRLGTGREVSANWLRRWCNTRELRVVSVRLTKSDAIVDYRAVAKIFRQIIREENFDDVERQAFVVNALLKSMYPKDVETREKVAYPTMRHALNISCPLTSSLHWRRSSSHTFQSDREASSNSNSRKSSMHDSPMSLEKFEAKIPTSLMLASLKDIFANLFSEQPLVIIIEDAHEMDEMSWRVFLSLMKIPMKTFIVITQEPIQYLMGLFSAVGVEAPIGELINPEATMAYDWVEGYVNRLTDSKRNSYVLLQEYSFSEVRTLIAGTLKVNVKDLPVGLDQMAFDLSGGNPFWVEQISTFLVTYGPQEFISSLEITGGNNIRNSIVVSLKNTGPGGIGTPATQASYIDESAEPSPGGKIVRGSSSKLFNLLGSIKSGSKLEFLVVCRFAKLSMYEQSIARTASIIGDVFTADVLHNALPIQLGAYMPAILLSLIENHWLKSKSEVNIFGVIKVEYSFTHPLMYKTLYDLTPLSVKRTIHLSIAQYIERTYCEDKSHFMSLGYHYCRSGDSRKTYEFLTRAAFEMVISERGSLDESIVLIQTAAAHIGSEIDAVSLLGVVCKAYQRLNEVALNESQDISEPRRGSFKRSSRIPNSSGKCSASDVLARRARFVELEESINEQRSEFRKKSQAAEAVLREKRSVEKEKDKEFDKLEREKEKAYEKAEREREKQIEKAEKLEREIERKKEKEMERESTRERTGKRESSKNLSLALSELSKKILNGTKGDSRPNSAKSVSSFKGRLPSLKDLGSGRNDRNDSGRGSFHGVNGNNGIVISNNINNYINNSDVDYYNGNKDYGIINRSPSSQQIKNNYNANNNANNFANNNANNPYSSNNVNNNSNNSNNLSILKTNLREDKRDDRDNGKIRPESSNSTTLDDFVSAGMDDWQKPLVAIRTAYLHNKTNELEHGRRISITNLMNSFIETPATYKNSAAGTKLPSSICTIN